MRVPKTNKQKTREKGREADAGIGYGWAWVEEMIRNEGRMSSWKA